MNTRMTVFSIALLLVGFVNSSKAQEICMVSADYINSENYIVFWEAATVAPDADSVIVYRKTASDVDFVRAGAVKTGAATYFVDENVDTKFATKYVIAFKDATGGLSAFSLWHQPFVFDYAGNGNFSNIPYLRQDQVIPISYNIMVDETGLGFFTQAGELSTSDVTDWFDDMYTDRPDAFYMVEVIHETCDVETKADINTSRSNIKQQVSTAALGIKEVSKEIIEFDVFPNPAENNELMFKLKQNVQNAEYWIADAAGRIIMKDSIETPTMTLNISNLSQGFYTISIHSNGSISTKNWVK